MIAHIHFEIGVVHLNRIRFNQWTEKGSEDQILRFWVEHKTVVTEPYAALYDNGI